MISIKISTALILYFAFFFALCLGLWLASHFKQRRKKGIPPLYVLITCEYCKYDFLAQTEKPVAKCPQCDAFNKNVR